MTGRFRRRGFERLVRRWFDAVHAHVTLVYPFADTNQVVRDVFARAMSEGLPHDAPSERAWLYALVRSVAYDTASNDEQFQRRNSEAVNFGLRDVLSYLSVDGSHELSQTVAALLSLSPRDQEILRLHTIEELDLAELAWILGREPDDTAAAISSAAAQLEMASVAVQRRSDREGEADA